MHSKGQICTEKADTRFGPEMGAVRAPKGLAIVVFPSAGSKETLAAFYSAQVTLCSKSDRKEGILSLEPPQVKLI